MLVMVSYGSTWKTSRDTTLQLTCHFSSQHGVPSLGTIHSGILVEHVFRPVYVLVDSDSRDARTWAASHSVTSSAPALPCYHANYTHVCTEVWSAHCIPLSSLWVTGSHTFHSLLYTSQSCLWSSRLDSRRLSITVTISFGVPNTHWKI